MVPGPVINHCLLKEYKEHVSVFETELPDVSCSMASIEDAKELPDEESQISNAIFSIGQKISKLLLSVMKAPTHMYHIY